MSDNDNIVINAASMRDGKKKLACAQAFKLSKEHGISLKEIGEICDKNDIRINSCQLGCFE